jgi:hypothetical protein
MNRFQDVQLFRFHAGGKTEQLSSLVKVQGREVMVLGQAGDEGPKAPARRHADQLGVAEDQEGRKSTRMAQLVCEYLDLVPQIRPTAVGIVDNQHPASAVPVLLGKRSPQAEPRRANAVTLSEAERFAGESQEVKRIKRRR